MRHVTRENYPHDPYFPGVAGAVTQLLSEGQVVAPIEVMILSGRLKRADYLLWRQGKIPYLERSVSGNLDKIGRILRILAYHAEDCGLKRSRTVYRRWGKGSHSTLRFSRSGEPALEEAWSTCFVRPRIPVLDAREEATGDSTAVGVAREIGHGSGARSDHS